MNNDLSAQLGDPLHTQLFFTTRHVSSSCPDNDNDQANQYVFRRYTLVMGTIDGSILTVKF